MIVYRPTKWLTKKNLRGCKHIFQHVFTCFAMVLESKLGKQTSVTRSTHKNTIWWHAAKDSNEAEKKQKW